MNIVEEDVWVCADCGSNYPDTEEEYGCPCTDRDDVTMQEDEGGRYFVQDGESKRYGYHAHFTGAYICYTCGALCNCKGEELSK